MPNTKQLERILGCRDKQFIDLLKRCFTWNPLERLDPQGACRHEWILEGLPPSILIHHMNLHSIREDELPK